MQITLLTEEEIAKLEAQMPINELAFRGLSKLEKQKLYTRLLHQFERKKRGEFVKPQKSSNYGHQILKKEKEALNYFTTAEIEQIKKAQKEHMPITAVAQFMGKDYEITRQAANALKRKCQPSR